MKRALLAAALALVGFATPAGAQVWPPISEWAPGGTINGATAPTYSLPITVLDSIRATLPPGPQRRTYTQLRNEALAEWQLPFVVVGAADLPVTSEGWLPPTNTITLIRAEVYFGQGNIQAASYIESSQSAAVTLSYEVGWRKWPGLYRSYLSHEIGHALGFGHPYADDFMGAAPWAWVMGSAYHVTDEERTIAAAYYGAAA